MKIKRRTLKNLIRKVLVEAYMPLESQPMTSIAQQNIDSRRALQRAQPTAEEYTQMQNAKSLSRLENSLNNILDYLSTQTEISFQRGNWKVDESKLSELKATHEEIKLDLQSLGGKLEPINFKIVDTQPMFQVKTILDHFARIINNLIEIEYSGERKSKTELTEPLAKLKFILDGYGQNPVTFHNPNNMITPAMTKGGAEKAYKNILNHIVDY